nr:MAG TPA: hypothetical protein [Caudoviricetes sp.]
MTCDTSKTRSIVPMLRRSANLTLSPAAANIWSG